MTLCISSSALAIENEIMEKEELKKMWKNRLNTSIASYFLQDSEQLKIHSIWVQSVEICLHFALTANNDSSEKEHLVQVPAKPSTLHPL